MLRRLLAQGAGQAENADVGAHPGEQFPVGDGPGDITIRPRLQPFRQIFRRDVGGRHDDDQHLCVGRHVLDAAADFETIEAAEVAIQQHEVGLLGGDRRERGLAGGRAVHGVTGFLQQVRGTVQEIGIIVHDQNAEGFIHRSFSASTAQRGCHSGWGPLRFLAKFIFRRKRPAGASGRFRT